MNKYSDQANSSSTDHYFGIDYLRATCAVLVVIWHGKAFSFLQTEQSVPIIHRIVDIFYYNLCLMSVPIFITIALLLFYKKQSKNAAYFFNRRLPQLLTIYICWSFIGILVNIFLNRDYINVLTKIGGIFQVVTTGSRPELYFFFSLIYLSLMAFINQKYIISKNKKSIILQYLYLFISILMLVIFVYSRIITEKSVFDKFVLISVDVNPICFFPYVFSSSILYYLTKDFNENQILKQSQKYIIFLLILLFLFFSYLEWNFLNIPQIFSNELPPYARPSLIIGSFIFVYTFVITNLRPPKFIKVLSRESLSIYVIHGYIFLVLSWFDKYYYITPFIKVIIAILSSIAIGYLVKKHSFGRIMLNG